MNRASIVSCFVMVGHLAIRAPGWADGVVARADFEKGLDGCSTWWGSPVNLTNELAHSGKQCLRIPGTTFAGTDYLPIKGRRLGFRLWLRGVEVQRGQNDWNNLTVQAQFYDVDKKPVGHNDYFHQEGTFDWREVSGAIAAMHGAAFVRLGVGLWGCAGTAYLDDLTVSIQAIELEAEEMSLVGAQPRNVEGASGDRAVDLTDGRQSLSTTVELSAGEYSLLVRARALQPDTFCEVSLLQDGKEIATLTPTCPIFTRQRRHFTVSVTGKVELAFQLKEGAGATLDQVTLSPLTAGLPITSLKKLWLDTNLGGDGKANCAIVLPGRGEYKQIGEDLAASLQALLGQRPIVVAADKLERSLRGGTHFICLGDYLNNHEILAVSPNPFFLIPKPPSGTPSVITCSDPWGTGANTIILGGADAATLSAATKRMLSLLRKTDGGTVLPWTWEPSPPIGVSREEYKRLVIESGKWMRQGGIRTLQTEWKQHGAEMFKVLGYRYLEYRDSVDTIPPLTDDGFTDAELLKIVSVWNAYEEFPSFSDAERLQLTNLIYEMARISEGPFSRYLFGSPHNLAHDEISNRIKSLKPDIRWNHQTFPAASLYWAGRYFWDYYRLPEAKDWLSFSAFLFEGQKPCFKPRCDCWGYQDITMIETFRHAVATEDETYLKSGLIDKFLELRLMSYDNQGSPCGYGDSGGYLGTFGPDFFEEGVRWWTSLGYQPNRKKLSAEALTGLKVHEMEPHFYEAFKGNQTMPLEKCFDKITFREKVDPSRAYLLLDGISGGNHGHTDGNSIVRFTDNGRIWLAEGDYLYGDMKDHNSLTLTRNAVGGKPDSFSTLESQVALPSFAATQTRTDHYNGATWDRHILWLRDRDVFFVFDEVKAKEAGVYDIKSRYRVRGSAEIKGPLLVARQKDDERFYLWDGAGSERRLSTDERDGETNWKSYPFSEDTSTKLLWHRWSGSMKPGDSRCLAAAFYAAGPNEVRRLELAPGGRGVVAIHGSLNAVVGVLPPSQPGMPQVTARQYAIGPEQISWVQGTRLIWGPLTVNASHPVDLDLNLKTGHGVIVTEQVTELTLPGSAKPGLAIDGRPARAQTVVGGVRVVIPAGRRSISAGRRFDLLSQVLSGRFDNLWTRLSSPAAATTPQQLDKGLKVEWEQSCASLITALWTADLDGDGVVEILTGTTTGLLEVRDLEGRTLWGHQFDATINDLCSVDLDGDGKQEVLCGVEDQTVYALKEGGAILWQTSFEPDASQGGGAGHVRVVTSADFENDGKPEVAVGCANSWFYVLDTKGQVRWKRQMQHKASAIGVADLDGDGFKELLCGYTYQARQIVDFSKSGWDQIRTVGGCISGCQTIASGDVDGDGKPEAIFGDKDGRLIAGKKGPPYNIDPVLQVMLGDDEVTRVVAADLDGDKKAELICSSRSNFVAAVGEGGKVRWVFPADNEVLDVAVGHWPGQPEPVIAAGSRDHRVYLLNAVGSPIGQLTMKGEVSRVQFIGKSNEIRIVACVGGEIEAIAAE